MPQHQPPLDKPITLRDLRKWVAAGQKFPMLTCYDATTASSLWRAGLRTLLVGDTAAQVILGHDSTLPAPMDFMLHITAAVRRGAPHAFIMADMPFGSYQCGDDLAMSNAVRFIKEGGADVVKLEVDDTFLPLVTRMAHAGVPVVAHVGSRPQMVRQQGGYLAAGRTQKDADQLLQTAANMLDAGAAMLLIEAVPAEVSQRIVALAEAEPSDNPTVPVVGCGAGPACHGHVVVLHDLLGLTPWRPPFVPPGSEIADPLHRAIASWVQLVQSGDYLRDGGPYHMAR
jgi:3-methyl-2-oxobutanoate hydroxymethyltransferase